MDGIRMGEMEEGGGGLGVRELYTLRVYIGRRDGQDGRREEKEKGHFTWFYLVLSCRKSADADGLEPGFNDRYVSIEESFEESYA